jgi:shikimate kinase
MPERSEVIVLVGPMGVGKTTVGRKLAKSLGLPFIDTDNLIVSEHGAISEIFESQGEPAFRVLEEQALARAISNPGVVATGGGAVLSSLSRERLKSTTVIYLATDGKHISSRLQHGSRPLIKDGLTDWKRIYDERKPIYEAVANFEIDTSGQPLKDTVNTIRKTLEL